MPVRFRVLGDLTAHVGDTAVELGPPQQRAVLAVLLAEAPRTVSVEQLIDRVWGDHAPRRVRGTLYSYLSRLRKALEPAGKEAVIARRQGGYALLVDLHAVDMHRFRLLVEQARAADDPSRAAALFEQALVLWRGDAFAACDTPWFSALREGLLRERFAAVLDRNDALLGLGRQGELLTGLAASVAEHPLDERLAGQYLLALYRSGRTADALACYEDIRRRLGEELGIDPGTRLRSLHQQVLTNDPALALSGTATAGPAGPVRPPVPVPRQLPAPPPRFTGRARELARLDRLLDVPDEQGGTVVITAISGTGGIGKTWLALRWAHRHLSRFPDGQLYANLRGFDPSAEPVPPTAALRGLLDALGADPAAIPADLDGQAGLYRSLTAGRRLLVVLDNIRDSDQVLPLLPGGTTCTVIITSRNRLTGLVATHGAHSIGLDAFAESEARELLTRHLGHHRTAAEPEAVTSLLAHCAGLPLAIGILAARAAAHPGLPLSALAEEVQAAATRLDALATGDVTADLRAVFSSSYHALDPGAAEVFALLGLTTGPDLSTWAAAALTGLPVPEVRALLRELQTAHLVQEHVPGRHRMHDLIRLYARERAGSLSPADRHAAQHRLLDFHLHSAHAAARRLAPHQDHTHPDPPRPGVTPQEPEDHDAALDWFTTEYPVLLSAVHTAHASGFDTHAWQLAGALETFFDYRGHWHDWAASQRTALAAAQRLGNRSWEAGAYRSLGSVYTQMGRLDDGRTHLQRALDLYERLDDQVRQAHTHRGLGWVCDLQGRRRDALDHNERALALYRRAGHRAGQAMALNNAGWLYAMLGDHRRAIDYCGGAVALNQEIGDRHAEAGAWDSLGYAHHHLTEYEDAIACYRRALDLVQGFGDRYGETEILIHLGDAHLAANDPDAARQVWKSARETADEIGHPGTGELRDKLTHLDRSLPDADPGPPSPGPA